MERQQHAGLVGKHVLVYERPGEPPIEAIVEVVDKVTGIIRYVKRADGNPDNYRDALLDVSTSIVLLIGPVSKFVRWVRSWFKKSKQ